MGLPLQHTLRKSSPVSRIFPSLINKCELRADSRLLTARDHLHSLYHPGTSTAGPLLHTMAPCLEYHSSLLTSASPLACDQHTLSACRPLSSNPVKTCISHATPLFRTLQRCPNHSEEKLNPMLASRTLRDLPPSHI